MVQAITIITVMGLVTIIAITALHPHEDNTQSIITILGFLAPTLASLIALMRSYDNRTSIKNIRTELADTKQTVADNNIQVLKAVTKDK